ncbi:L,D-transpeptidase family protein [Rickettsiales bacterium]|nr:L,D-transpeptidase family protein [Rickettsiales bacterium]
MKHYARLFLVLFIASPTLAVSATYDRTEDVIGEVRHYTIGKDETLYSIARKFDLGIVEVMAANPGIDPWLPGQDTLLFLPLMHVLPDTERSGIVINLSGLRLFYFPDDKTVMSFPIGIGKEGWRTPVGITKIALKRKDPTWIPPSSIRKKDPELPKFVPPGPDNPLGKYALNLGIPELAIHGTNKPYGIGSRSSHGCIRMYPEDIEVLFNNVSVGIKVTIIDSHYNLGWKNNILFLEVRPTQEQSDTIMNHSETTPYAMPEVYDMIAKKAGTKAGIRWPHVEDAIRKHDGIVVPIFTRP